MKPSARAVLKNVVAALTIALVIFLTAGADLAQAHARSESYSNWDIAGTQMRGVVTVSTGEIMALMDNADPQPLEELFGAHLSSTVEILAGDETCALSEPQGLSAPRGFLRMELSAECGNAVPDTLHYHALFDALPAHVHYARVFADEDLLSEQLITHRANTWRRDDETVGHSLTAFLDLGVRHILSGIDHIAFLAGMLLVAGGLARSVAAVTGFTLGHSISLAAAVLGYLNAEGRLVEAFIGFTVALVAVEYFFLRRPEARSLPAVAGLIAWATGGIALYAGLISPKALAAYLGFGVFAWCYLLAANRGGTGGTRSAGTALFAVTTCFGLVHGFGFAGFLMDTGITGDSLLVPLLGFNLGVELGQLALLCLAFVAAWLLRNTQAHRLAPLGAAALAGIGVFWFVGRSLAA